MPKPGYRSHFAKLTAHAAKAEGKDAANGQQGENHHENENAHPERPQGHGLAMQDTTHPRFLGTQKYSGAPALRGLFALVAVGAVPNLIEH